MSRSSYVVLISGCFLAITLGIAARLIIVNSTGLTDVESSSASVFESLASVDRNVLVDKAEPTVDIDANGINLGFMQPAKGKVSLINTTDARQSRSFNIDSKKGKDVNIPLPGISDGKWKMKFEWESDGKSYFYEEDVFVK
jgi:hypothetical protein